MKTANNRQSKQLLLLWPALLIGTLSGLGVIIFSAYYLIHTHAALQSQYLQAVPCMYRQDLWQEGFFNQQTKHAGNIYASVAIIAAIILMIWTWRRANVVRFEFCNIKTLFRAHKLPLAGLLLLTLALWFWGFITSVPAYDEVFSAINCAGVNPVQTSSYYMLPNNHILFNLINNIIFHPFNDKVITGRIISGFSELTLAAVLYWWLFKKLENKVYAFGYTTLLLMQFPVWGFSFQARGYALYLLCTYVSAIGLEQYFSSRQRLWLMACTIATVAGYCIMPSFLMWHAALLLIAVGYFFYEKKVDVRFIKAQVFAGLCIYCFYLPGICYSGLPAFTDNIYVKAQSMPFTDFWREFQKSVNSTIQYSFGADVDAHSNIYTVLFYVPLLITPFLIRTKARFLLLLNLATFAAFILLQLRLRHYPFMRNMIAHVSISFAALLFSLHFSLSWLQKKFKLKAIRLVGMLLFCGASAVHFVRFMNGHIHDSLYFYDAKTGYDLPMSTIGKIPRTASVWCSDQSFYLQYLLIRRGSAASHCMTGDQAYFISDRNEGKPPVSSPSDIKPADSVLQYIIYKKQ